MPRLRIVSAGTPTPTPDRWGTCFVLEICNARLMIDCGPASTYKMHRIGGGDVMNYLQQLIERGRREGIQEGELKGQIRTIEGFLERDFSWSTIAAATGVALRAPQPRLVAR